MLTTAREIERLEAHVQQLEKQLQDSRQPDTTLSSFRTVASPGELSSSLDLNPMEDHQGHHRQWQGIWTTTPTSSEAHLSGPSSKPSFHHALGTYISSSLQLPQPEFQMQPTGASRFRANPTLSPTSSLNKFPPVSDSDDAIHLTRDQEGYFLALFWQSYHCTMPILNEVEFRESYQSLWSSRSPPHSLSREASPLVDIMLALCMQYGMALVPRNRNRQTSISDFDNEDSTIAGRALYHRCQTLVSSTMETPSILTLQCQILSAIYLRNASFVNMSHNTLASAIRTAQVLGLHQDSRASSSRGQKELHRRLWWVLYDLESLACMDLGRPWLIQMSQVQCAPSSDDRQLATLSGPSFVSKAEGITWLSYHVQHVKLILAARAVYAAFESRVTQVLRASNEETFHGDAPSLEGLAEFLLSSLTCLRKWVQDVPDALKIERKDGGKPFSTDRSIMQIDLEAPQWLQRQQLMLELTYHQRLMSLYRPFITFTQVQSSSIPLSNSNSILSLNHAITITIIMSQILKSTDVLNGWYEAYQLQWNATLTIVGFIFANPVCPPTPTARRTLNSAIKVFESFCNSFAIAASATIIARDLAAKVDIYLDCFRTGSRSGNQTPPPTPNTVGNTVNLGDVAGMGLVQDFNENNRRRNTSNSSMLLVDHGADYTTNQILSDGFPMEPFSGADWSFPNGTTMSTEPWPWIG